MMNNPLTRRLPKVTGSRNLRDLQHDKLNDTSFVLSAFVMNRLKIPNLTQEILATTERLDWHKQTVSVRSHKPLPLIQDHRGRQIIPKDYFINNDLEYMKGGDLSRRRRIIAVTRLKIMKKYDYGHLEEIDVHRDDQKLYTFKEDRISGTKLHTLHTHYKRKRLMCVDELYKFSDGTLNDVRSDLHEIVARIRMEYLPMRKWSNLDKKRARVMVQDIDKQLYKRRLMWNLEKFVGGKEYENDLRLLERTI
ncbi:hypothetical protein Tco_0739437 [Tanacetum coccineum]